MHFAVKYNFPALGRVSTTFLTILVIALDVKINEIWCRSCKLES